MTPRRWLQVVLWKQYHSLGWCSGHFLPVVHCRILCVPVVFSWCMGGEGFAIWKWPLHLVLVAPAFFWMHYVCSFYLGSEAKGINHDLGSLVPFDQLLCWLSSNWTSIWKLQNVSETPEPNLFPESLGSRGPGFKSWFCHVMALCEPWPSVFSFIKGGNLPTWLGCYKKGTKGTMQCSTGKAPSIIPSS